MANRDDGSVNRSCSEFRLVQLKLI